MQFNKYNGFLNIYKEAGWTSMDVCAKLRGILGMRKIGHAGTLDPMAEGVLPVALGKGTKDVDRIGDGTKTYIAGMLLGTVTDTQDITGTVISENTDKIPTNEEIIKACESFIGEYEQLTPMYSARKVNGKKLYEYARAGKEVERKRKKIEILDLTVDSIDFPHIKMTVKCTKGTYIRTLCHDIGEKLGTGACMESLLRTQVGDFTLEETVKLDELEKFRDQGKVNELISVKSPTAVAIGKFDGNHIGHRLIIKELVKTAQENKYKSLIILFDMNKSFISGRQEQKEELYSYGVDYVIELPFSEEIRTMSAEDFLEKILIKRLNMKAMVAGNDVSFGFNKRGNAEFLTENADRLGYSLKIIEKINIKTNSGEEQAVSSTMLRELISEGDMEKTEMLLGHPYCISGYVEHGKGMGHSILGYPTMNIDVDASRIVPPYGVYAVRVHFIDEKTGKRKESYKGIANLGIKPTVSNEDEAQKINLESFVFEYEGNAYGKKIEVELLKFIRKERKFESLEEIKIQLRDVDIPKVKKFYEDSLKSNENA
ncbi:MAG: tRNA pseudouridine(55) synthase TruB [Eubacteriales bacterium]|nr:tRNA pseudouridine(55) synthase TruB [Eubacteriales bacterium]